MKKWPFFAVSIGIASGMFAADNLIEGIWITPKLTDGDLADSAYAHTEINDDMYTLIDKINEKFNPKGLYVLEVKHKGNVFPIHNMPAMTLQEFVRRKPPTLGHISVTLTPHNPELGKNIKGE